MGKRQEVPVRMAIAITILLTPVLAGPVGAQPWVAAWGSSMQSASPETWSVTDATVRLIARATMAGDQVRVRLENTFGEAPLEIGIAAIGLQANGAALVPGSSRPLRFGGAASVSIPPGQLVMSDPVALPIEAEQRLAVSLYLPGAAIRSSQHANGLTTSYVTARGTGDQTGAIERDPFTGTTTSMHWLSAIEVRSATARGAIIAFGDSITDGSCATVDGYDRWEDVLYARLRERDGEARLAMVNAGIGGNTVIRVPPVGSVPGVERLDRDALDLAGVTHLVLFLGTNDLRRDATAEQVIAGLEELVGRAKERGLVVAAATIIPRNPVPRGLPANLGFTEARNAARHRINDWIRGNDDLDAVLDFDAVVKDGSTPNLINSIYDCDGIHPNVLGYAAMGRAIDLSVFDEAR